MTSIEDQVRAALTADAQTVTQQSLRPFPDPARAAARPRQARWRSPIFRRLLAWASHRRVLAPLAAAAAVAAVAATVIALPELGAKPRSLTSGPTTIAQGFPGGRMPAAAPPKFFVAIVGLTTSDDTKLEIVSTATGRVTGTLKPPVRGRNFQAAAALGDNNTFVVAASGRTCHTWFYRFSLTPSGRPAGLAPLSVPSVPGRPTQALEPDATGLAVSADGSTVAYASNRCGGQPRAYYGQVGVINVPAAKVTTWKFRWPATPFSLSLTADGRLLGLVSNPSSGQAGGYTEHNSQWTVRTSSPAGWLAQRYRRVFGPPHYPTAAVLSPNGKIVFAVTPVLNRRGYHHHEPLRAYQTATGRLIRQILVFPKISQGPSLNADVTGRYLLAFFLTDRVKWLDLATGRLHTVPGFGAIVMDLAW